MHGSSQLVLGRNVTRPSDVLQYNGSGLLFPPIDENWNSLLQRMMMAYTDTPIFPVSLPSQLKVDQPHWHAALVRSFVLTSRLVHGLNSSVLSTRSTATFVYKLHMPTFAHFFSAIICGRVTPNAIYLIRSSAALTVLLHLCSLLNAKLHLEYSIAFSCCRCGLSLLPLPSAHIS